jgi:Ca2+-transporting ATPase
VKRTLVFVPFEQVQDFLPLIHINIGIVGIKDPARPEVAQSILSCTDAGIRVMMITGDAKDTAIAIARDVNIFPAEEESSEEPLKAFEGREFFHKPEHEQLNILKTGNIVFCRAEPSDKQKLIKMLQSLDEISAMTGDGKYCPTRLILLSCSF